MLENQENINHWRDLLKKRKKIVLQTEGNLKRHAVAELSAEGTGEVSKVRLHPADLATETQEIETLESLSEKNIKNIQAIEDALDRLGRGTYGICENCGDPIPEKRLELLPETRYCVECEKEKREMEKQVNSQKKLNTMSIPEETIRALSKILVSDIMRENPTTVHADENLDTAAGLLEDNEFLL